MANKDTIRRQVLRFLQKESVMVVSTVTSRGRPHGAAVYYFMEDDFTVYFMTRQGTRKNMNISKDAHVAGTIGFDAPFNVQLEGKAKAVKSGARAVEIYDRLAKVASSHDFWPPILRIGKSEYKIYEVRPAWLRALDLRGGVIGDGAAPYTVLIP